MTVLEAITKGTEFLTRKGIESPRLQVELLLAHLLNLPRLRLYLEFERALSDAQSDALRELLVKRGNHVPLQHLVGSTSFCGCPIIVSSAVLVPRPETETLAEEAWKFLNGLGREATFLDMGTGSGCLPIAIASHCKTVRGVGIDVSEAALTIAKENVLKNNLSDRIELRTGDIFSTIEERFDFVVSNPPYIPTSEINSLQPEVRDHDPRGALDGGDDGLKFYRAIATNAPAPRVMVEFGDGQAAAVREIFAAAGWSELTIVRDLSKRERVLVAIRN
jgi:release factor glutamine methyltransferase